MAKYKCYIATDLSSIEEDVYFEAEVDAGQLLSAAENAAEQYHRVTGGLKSVDIPVFVEDEHEILHQYRVRAKAKVCYTARPIRCDDPKLLKAWREFRRAGKAE